MAAMPNVEEDEDRRQFAVCLTEIVNWSKYVNEAIERIAEAKPDLSENGLNELLANLVNVKIYMYDELRCWMRELRRPLQKVANAVEDKLYEIEGKGNTDT